MTIQIQNVDNTNSVKYCMQHDKINHNNNCVENNHMSEI